MTEASISQPLAKTFSVVDLVAATLSGRLRIPDFQRPLRWQWEDVRRLFDSIVKGYPIGSLLLWSRPAPAGSIRLGGLRIEARRFEEGWWVVDGQQRLTSLANALSEQGSEDERFALAYDLRHQIFCHPGRGGDGLVIPLPVLFDLQRLIRWFTIDYPDAGEGLEEASRVTRAIREYQVPAYLVSQEDETVLRDIFDRMNNYGKRLSRAEVFAALHPGDEGGMEPASLFQRIAVSIHAERSFGLLDDDTVMQAVLARRGGNVTRDIRVEFSDRTQQARDFGWESPENAYRDGELALSRAVAFLQEDAGVPHFAFLPYRYLLVVLTRFFAHYPEPQPANRRNLRRWFWRAAMVGPGPFASSWTNAARTLATRITSDDEDGSVQRLLDPPIDHDLRLPPLTGFRTNAAASRIVLTALWDLGPCSLVTGQRYGRGDLAESIQPEETLAGVAQRILRREPLDRSARAANRMLVLDQDLPRTVAELLVSPPLQQQGDPQRFLDSHALDKGLVEMLARRAERGFLDTRQRLMERIVRAFLERMAETRLEDTPPLESLDFDESEEIRDDLAV